MENTVYREGHLDLKHKDNADFALIGIDRDEPLDKITPLPKIYRVLIL